MKGLGGFFRLIRLFRSHGLIKSPGPLGLATLHWVFDIVIKLCFIRCYDSSGKGPINR